MVNYVVNYVVNFLSGPGPLTPAHAHWIFPGLSVVTIVVKGKFDSNWPLNLWSNMWSNRLRQAALDALTRAWAPWLYAKDGPAGGGGAAAGALGGGGGGGGGLRHGGTAALRTVMANFDLQHGAWRSKQLTDGKVSVTSLLSFL